MRDRLWQSLFFTITLNFVLYDFIEKAALSDGFRYLTCGTIPICASVLAVNPLACINSSRSFHGSKRSGKVITRFDGVGIVYSPVVVYGFLDYFNRRFNYCWYSTWTRGFHNRWFRFRDTFQRFRWMIRSLRRRQLLHCSRHWNWPLFCWSSLVQPLRCRRVFWFCLLK